MTRAAVAGLLAPRNSRLLVDFTKGDLPAPVPNSAATAGDRVVYDNFGANAVGRVYTADNRGLGIYFAGASAGQTAHISYRPATPWDLSGEDFLAVELDFEEGGGGFFNIVQVYITQESGTAYTNYGRISVATSADKMPHRPIHVVRFSAQTGWTLTSGGPDGFPNNMTTIGKIDFNIACNASSEGAPAQVFIRKVWVGKNRSKVIFTFDDGHAAQATDAAPVMAAAGFKGVLCCSSSYIGKVNRLSLENIAALDAYGWDFGVQQTNDATDALVSRASSGSGLTRSGAVATWNNSPVVPHLKHTGDFIRIRGAVDPSWNRVWGPITRVDDYSFTFACEGTEVTPATGYLTIDRLSAAEITANIRREIDFWSGLGYTRGNFSMAYATGAVADSVLDAVAQAGIIFGRTTDTGSAPMTRTFDARLTSPRSLLMLPSASMDRATAATVLGYVDAAIGRGASICLFGHNIAVGVGTGVPLTIDSAEFAAMVAGIKDRVNSGLCDVVTFSEYSEQMLGRAKSP